MQAKDVSIIVPVYNGGSKWQQCLDALIALDPAPLEVIVVDDGSTDDSRVQAGLRGFKVLESENARNGPGLARNLGASSAQGEVLFFVDADVVVPRDAVSRVASALADPAVDAIFGSYDDEPAAKNFVSQYKNLMHHFVHQTSGADSTSFWAGCGAVRKSAFRAVNGFASCYRRPSIEDIELGYRLRHAGYQIRLVKDLQSKHLKVWTFRTLVSTDVLNRAVPWAELLFCERELPADLNLRTAHRLSTMFCFLLPISFLGLFITPVFFVLLGLLLIGLLALNIDLYGFFLGRRGTSFAVRAILLHWLYYYYSGLAFAAVLVYLTWRYPDYMFKAFILARFQNTAALGQQGSPEGRQV